MRPRLGPLAAVVLLTGAHAAARQAAIRDSRPFRSGVELTSLSATVIDRDGHPVVGLPREAFEIDEDGVRQQITQFTSERVPIALGVLIDTSDSMFGRRIDDARMSVDRLLFSLLSRDDEFFLMAFNHQPRLLTGWTADAQVVRPALAGLKPSGGTAAYDAILRALPIVEHRSRERAAILVISDGADTASDAKARDVLAALRRSEAFVYAIAIDSPDPQPINTRVNALTLREITDGSGGRTEIVHDSHELDAAAARVADELNSQYVLGYTPPRGPDGQFHNIRVRIPASSYRVRARSGYVAARG